MSCRGMVFKAPEKAYERLPHGEAGPKHLPEPAGPENGSGTWRGLERALRSDDTWTEHNSP
jgi:hypothetical protein